MLNKRRQENKSSFFVFLVENQTPFVEIQCQVPRQGGRWKEAGLTAGNGHLYAASWNAHCGWGSTPDSDSSPQVTSCLFSLSCDPKILTGEAWHSCLGLSSWSHWYDSQVISTTVGRAEKSRAVGPHEDLAWCGGRGISGQETPGGLWHHSTLRHCHQQR